MGISIRQTYNTWNGPWSNSRDIYQTVTTYPGDYLVCWTRGDNTGTFTTYDYDYDTGGSMSFTKLAEYSRGDNCDSALYVLNPGSNVGTKNMHFYYDNGIHCMNLYTFVLRGVLRTNAVMEVATEGHYYGCGGENNTGYLDAQPNSGLELNVHYAGFYSFDDTDYSVDYSTDPWTGYHYQSVSDGTARIHQKVRTRVPGPGDTDHFWEFCHGGTGPAYSGQLISLRAAPPAGLQWHIVGG